MNPSRKERGDIVEIRVHGIGLHRAYSALDEPPLESNHVQIVTAPIIEHPLYLINWSRASRNRGSRILGSFIWYLSFPFTLVNTVGYMGVPRTLSRTFLRMVVVITSVWLATAVTVWGSAIVETIIEPFTSHANRYVSAFLICALIPGTVIAAISYRQIVQRKTSTKVGYCSAVACVLAVAAVAWLLYLNNASALPGKRQETYRQIHGGFQSFSLQENPQDPVKWVVTSAAIPLLLAMLIGLFILIRRGRSTEHGASYSGAVLVIFLSVLLVVTVGSIVRQIASAVVKYADNYIGNTIPSAAPHVFTGFWFDLIPAASVGFFVLFLTFALFVYGLNVGSVRSRARGYRRSRDGIPQIVKRESVVHNLLSHVGVLLPIAVIVSAIAILSAVVIVSFAGRIVSPDIVIKYQLILLTLVVVIRFDWLYHSWTKLRIFCEMVGDIAGFWAPDIVPLACDSYRPAAIEAIGSLVSQNPRASVALVGHSQGSVLCVWYVSQLCNDEQQTVEVEALIAGKSNRITLVTCGSPVQSLYATFFPAFFDKELFERVSRSSCEWLNFWRRTDPIATPVLVGDNDEPRVYNCDITELATEPTLGHSHYWRDVRMNYHVRRALGTMP